MFTVEERRAIREQLDRVIVSSPFRHSKRCPKLLRYVVEYALSGNATGIKERTLGTELFGLEPGYDTSLHPVVRMTAVEIRKRLNDYYETPGRENEIRIVIPRGSYVPEFTLPQSSADDDPLPADLAPVVNRVMRIAIHGHARKAILFIVVAALCVSIGWKIFADNTALASFWSPVLNSKAPVLVCMPNPTDLAVVRAALVTNPQQLLNLPVSGTAAPLHDRTSFSDSVALSSVGRFLGDKQRTFFVRRASTLEMKDLSGSPAVLIGAFDNRWTVALSTQMRYSFAVDGQTLYIRDSQNPTFRDWSLSSSLAPSQDYGIISRTFTATTGNFLVTVAGLGRDATLAAGDCVSDTACIEQARKYIRGDWKHKNLEIVFTTTVTGGTPGKPRVLNAYSW